MICTTVRQGEDCLFMSAKGCSFNGGVCRQVIESCNGCGRTTEYQDAWYCTACPDPAGKWKNGVCNFATHAKAEEARKGGGKVNPLKASKRANRPK